MSKKKVAYITNHASFFFSHMLSVANKIKKKYKIKLFHGLEGSKTMEIYALKKIKKNNISSQKFSLSPGGINIFREFFTMISILKSISSFKPDIIHCATPKGILYGGLVSKILKIKSLVIFNTGMGFLFSNKLSNYEVIVKNIYIWILKNIILKHKNKKIIIENKDDISFFKNRYGVRKNEIVFIKGAGVNLKKFKPNYSNSKKIVLMPSRVIKEKGVYEFIYAAKEVKKIFPKWNFYIAGTLDYNKKSSLSEKDFLKLKNIKEVIFLGYVKNMKNIYKKSSIVCLPSYREGFSKVFLEAAAMGIPVITTNVIGCKDSIIPGKTGLLCMPKNVKSLEKSIKFLIKNKNIRLRYSKNARQFALKNFDINKVIFKNLEIYEKLLKNEKKINLHRT